MDASHGGNALRRRVGPPGAAQHPGIPALLLEALLSPTDPVLAAAIVGRKEIPGRLRHLLNVESGLNDGLALPFVLFLTAALRLGPADPAAAILDVAGGVALGAVVPVLIGAVLRIRWLSASETHRPLLALSIGLVILSLSAASGANEYLAAFTGGISVATAVPGFRADFDRFGELIAELMKLSALLAFGALVSQPFLLRIPASGWIFAGLALAAVRPAALGLSLLGSGLPWKQRLVASWFGPKGFATVVYSLHVLRTGAAWSGYVAHLAALVVIGSILAHSSTDVAIARWFRKR